MNCTRPLMLAVSALVLLISACSQTEGLNTPTLVPQFGGIYDEAATHVAINTAGVVAVGATKSYIYVKDPKDINEEYVYGTQLQLRTYNSEGDSDWIKVIKTYECDEDDLGTSQCVGLTSIVGVQIDAVNNIYALTTRTFETIQDVTANRTTLYKYDDVGTLLWEKEVGFAPSASLSSDLAGNLYVARTDDSVVGVGNEDNYVSGSHLSKYSTNGTLQWEKDIDVGTVRDVVVSSTGNVYTVGSSGYSRHRGSNGSLTWRRSGGGDEIAIAGSNLFIRTGKTLRKLDGSGKQVWSKLQTSRSTTVFQNLAGDTSGNVYLSGMYTASGGNRNAFARKINIGGSNVWTRTYGTSAYDDARGVSTIDGGAVYVVGESGGALAGYNRGGSDGYVRKLNSRGNTVWTH